MSSAVLTNIRQRFAGLPDSHRSRRWTTIVLAGLLLLAPSSVSAGSEPVSAEEAAREIQAARDRANDAADAYFEAQSDLVQLEEDLARLEERTTEIQRSVDLMERRVASAAVQRFVEAGSHGIPILTDLEEPADHLQANVLFGVVANDSRAEIDEFEQLVRDLDANEADIADQRRAIEDRQDELVELQAAAEAEVERLRDIELVRLTNVAVQRALQAQQSAEQARIDEQARREAEAAANAIPDPAFTDTATTTSTTVPQTTQEVDGETPQLAIVDDTPAETAPPTTVLPTNDGASGGTSGGRTGTGGPGSKPAGYDTAAGYVDIITCPILGSGYGDTWGAARSGGRRHQGVDMIAPAGVPIYAVTSGYVTFKQNRLGGNAASLMGDNGNRYYFAHFSRYEGSSRRVAAGDIIGYNGKTGNTTTNHLHFELRPGAGLNVNPYPSVKTAGC
ncbi:MAG: peptidoglycan DD-metalloendopeptidase family protein [Ilumatobacter sp.]|uniref:M23 family metallopeptidase n=1 Tax=Ilumatobacter sp. TaxID=1967498 RepID=UPI00391A0C53